MDRLVCYITKEGEVGICLRDDLESCEECPFYKKYRGVEREYFSYTFWTGELTYRVPCRHVPEDDPLKDKRSCGFLEDGTFNPMNWNCELLNKIRLLCHPLYRPDFSFWNDDQYLGVVPIYDPEQESFLAGSYALLTWYKLRGNTEGFWIFDGRFREGTEKDALEIVKLYQEELEELEEEIEEGYVDEEE